MPAGSMVNPPPDMPQFTLAARLARLRSRLLGLVGWSCPSGSAVPGCLHLLQAFAPGWEPLRGILCSEPVADKRGRRVTAKGIGSAQLHYPSQPLSPLAGHSRLAGASRAHRWVWQLGFLGHLQPALVLSLHQAAPKYCLSLRSTVAVNQDRWLLTSHRQAAMQCWAWRATPKTPSEPLLTKHPWSGCSQEA